jgi:hypothetical protein
MVSVYTGSFRGVRDQSVTDQEGSVPAGVHRIRRVFGGYSAGIRRLSGGYSAQLRALGHGRLVLAGSSRLGYVGPAPMRSEPEVPVRPAPAVSTMKGEGPSAGLVVSPRLVGGRG